MSVEIDPEILAARAAQAARFGAFDVTAMPAAEARTIADAAAGMFNDGLPEMARVEDRDVAGMRLRVYVPHERRARGSTYYLHGGGWLACSVDTHDRLLRSLAELTGAPVFSADYRLCPEHPHPAPLDDVAKGWDWIEANAATFGADAARIAVAGDSAGGNLSLALMLRLRDAARPLPAGAALLYGCFAPGLDSESARTFGQGGYGLTDERMQWYWRNYLGGGEAIEAMPLRAPDLSRLPPIFLGIAEADTVADDSRLLAARLAEAGVATQTRVWPGTVHGFLQMSRDVASARAAIGDVADALRPWIA
ncbi:MAG: alpha/beta hydrolase [Novosphingobium sp.]|nr:alpha/beta hydrolase [Novosphingobium sp.]